MFQTSYLQFYFLPGTWSMPSCNRLEYLDASLCHLVSSDLSWASDKSTEPNSHRCQESRSLERFKAIDLWAGGKMSKKYCLKSKRLACRLCKILPEAMKLRCRNWGWHNASAGKDWANKFVVRLGYKKTTNEPENQAHKPLLWNK